MLNAEDHFWHLCEEAYRLDLAHDSCLAYEAPMIELIRLVQSNVEQRSTFVRCFSEIVLSKRRAPDDLVPFCMRTLRFPEIKELVQQEARQYAGSAHSARRMNFWSHVLHAYDDAVWEDAGMWPFYAHELRPQSDMR